MGFKRAQWKSGLTYKQVCDQCKTVNIYKDDVLDFRPWFADGFIYCKKCNKPLRHNENYAIDDHSNEQPKMTKQKNMNFTELFCPQCGKKHSEDDNFCSHCGRKRN